MWRFEMALTRGCACKAVILCDGVVVGDDHSRLARTTSLTQVSRQAAGRLLLFEAGQ